MKAHGIVTALIYTRVSSEEQAREGISLDAQLAECRRYAADKQWVIGAEYQDVMSGKRDDRPAYQALLAEVRRLRAAGRPVVVVVLRLDRFGRRMKERVERWEEFKAIGAAVHSVRDGGEVTTLYANILAALAQEEVERLGARVSDARQHFTRNGWWAVGDVPWGYRLRDATEGERRLGSPRRVIEVDPETAPFVRDAFDRALRGESIRSIARWAAGLPSTARGNRKMSHQAVNLILRSSTYPARLADGTAGRWEPLVDDGTWREIQRRTGDHRKMPRQASNRYLLSGLLRCPECAARMAGWCGPRRGLSYRCNNHLCRRSFRGTRMDEAMLAEVEAVLSVATARNAALLTELHREWDRISRPQGSADDRAKVANLERDAERARERLTTAAVMLVDDRLDKPGYDRLRDKAQADLDAAEAELARLSVVPTAPALPPLDEVLRQVGDWAAIMREQLEVDVATVRPVLRELVERAVPVFAGRKARGVAITWTPLGDALHSVARTLASDFAA